MGTKSALEDRSMSTIKIGEIVAGDHRGWWEVIDTDTTSPGRIMLTAIDSGAGMLGFLFGAQTDTRQVRVQTPRRLRQAPRAVELD